VSGLAIDYRKTAAEQGMLLNLHKTSWTEGLKLRDFKELGEGNEKAVKVCCILASVHVCFSTCVWMAL
jgi:26S proteasome regulatory subunit N11